MLSASLPRVGVTLIPLELHPGFVGARSPFGGMHAVAGVLGRVDPQGNARAEHAV